MQTLTKREKNIAVCIIVYCCFCRRAVLDAIAGIGKA